ncbi:SoxR reducing system RseC family protein [Niveibacterium terrae]|uniref:SoxR reducing system RseC family protein n=1 Tax=Niveibacterium terrae TaxID=3373598 RepID=UPI003A91E816
MLERSATVVSIDRGKARLRFERESACGACRARGHCAGSGEAGEIDLPLPAGMRLVNDGIVTVELGARELISAGLILYGLPMAGFLIALMAASLAGWTDAWIGGAAFAGLGLGFLVSRQLARLPRFQRTPRIAQPESK